MSLKKNSITLDKANLKGISPYLFLSGYLLLTNCNKYTTVNFVNLCGVTSGNHLGIMHNTLILPTLRIIKTSDKD